MLARHKQAAEWLQLWPDLERAPGTIDAYARALTQYLAMCDRKSVDLVTANRADVAAGVGQADATSQQRLVPR